MKPRTPSPHRARGAVLVLVTLAMLTLFGMLGVVVDLGYLYVRKTELQNAADAAALSAVRSVDGTAAGIDAAVNAAIATAGANASDFAATPVAITSANVDFGSTPDGPWHAAADAKQPANVGNMWYIKVDTSGIAQGTRPTWFMKVVSNALASTTTSGYAVAGRTLCETLPIFSCMAAGASAPDYGFVAGQSYLFAAKDPAIPVGPGNIGWFDPVPPGAPGMIQGANDMREVLCRGKGYCLPAPETYTSLTQAAFSPMADALNTRFDEFLGPLNDATHKQQCAADTNIREYIWDDNGAGAPKNWMTNAPTEQSEDKGASPGVHWSVVRPGAGAVPAVSSSYPGSGTPYGQANGQYFKAPTKATASESGRRIVTLALVDNCPISGSGKPAHIVAYGRFLMQIKAMGSGTEKGFYGEYLSASTSPPTSTPDIKLFR